MIPRIAIKEFYNNLVSARFIIGFILCLVLIPFSIVVGIQEYRSRVDIYQVERKQAEDSVKVSVWSAYKPEVVKPPEPLSIFSRGISGNVGNKVKVYLGEVPMLASGRVSVRDNPFLNSIFTLDFTTVLAILMSLLALIFSYDVCTGEKEEGTLKLMLSNPISRSTVLAGKGLGVLLTLLPIVFFCYLLSAIIILAWTGVSFSAAEWGRIVILALVSIVYFTVWVSLGMFISSRSRSSVTAIVTGLFVWVTLVFIIPSSAVYAARSFVSVQSQENLNSGLAEIDRERDEHMQQATSAVSLDGIFDCAFASQSVGYDGHFELRGAEKNYYEYYRRTFEIEAPIRVEYSGKKWPVQQAYLDELHRQAAAARAIGMVSPVQLFRLAADALCRTDMNAHDSFMVTARRYREVVLDYFNNKKVYSSYLWLTPLDPKTFKTADEVIEYTTNGHLRTVGEFVAWAATSDDPISVFVRNDPAWDNPGTVVDDSDAPQFDWRPDSLGDSMQKSLGGLGGMALGVLLLFFLSFVSFTRFDVR